MSGPINPVGFPEDRSINNRTDLFDGVRFVASTALSTGCGAFAGYVFSRLFLPAVNPIVGAAYIATSSLVQACTSRILETLLRGHQNSLTRGTITVASVLTGAVAGFGVLALTTLTTDPKATAALGAVSLPSVALGTLAISIIGIVSFGAVCAFNKVTN